MHKKILICKSQALYLPWAIIAQKFVMSGGDIPKSSIAGLLSAHLYYYLTTIYPSQGGRRFLQTPDFIKQLFVTRPRNPATNVFGRHTWGSGRRLDSQIKKTTSLELNKLRILFFFLLSLFFSRLAGGMLPGYRVPIFFSLSFSVVFRPLKKNKPFFVDPLPPYSRII